MVKDEEHNIGALRRLGALGVRFALDDFGTSYSALPYLRRLPVGLLKFEGPGSHPRPFGLSFLAPKRKKPEPGYPLVKISPRKGNVARALLLCIFPFLATSIVI